MISLAKRAIKSAFLPGTQPRKVLFGAGRGITLSADRRHSGQRYFGLAELEIARDFVDFAKRSKSFCDVGASDGWYCLLARKHNANLQITAVEPAPLPDTPTNLRLNRLDEGPEFRWIKKRCGSDGLPLDQIAADCPSPLFLKIDIDGGELDALSSGPRILRDKARFLIVETHTEELEKACIDLVQDIGYSVRIIPNGWYRAFVPELRPIRHNRWFSAVRAGRDGTEAKH
jgi:hypothetical protein